MTAEGTNQKEDKTKSEGSGPMGPGMLDMMKKCCTSEGAFSDCAAMMKNRMGAMTTMPCCGSGIHQSEPDRREK